MPSGQLPRIPKRRSRYLPWDMGLLTFKAMVSLETFSYLTIVAPQYLRFIVVHHLPSSLWGAKDRGIRRIVFAGTGLAALIGPFGLAWNIYTVIYASDLKPKTWYITWNFLELIIASSLVTAVGIQGIYIPTAGDWCSSADTENLFKWASAIWKQSPYENCRGWLVIWIMCLVGGVLSIIGVIIGIFLYRTRPKFTSDDPSPAMRYDSKALDFLVRFLDTWIPQTFVILPWVLYRYIQKKRNPRLSSPSHPERPSLKGKHAIITNNGSVKDKTSGLVAEMLSCYPIRKKLLEESHLCYVDIVNLASSSRTIWNAVFDIESSDACIRTHSCLPGKRRPCYCCKVQTCNNCSRSQGWPLTEVGKHLEFCDTYCTSCYLWSISTAQWRFDIPWRCTCIIDDSVPYLFRRHGNATHGQLSDFEQEQFICTACQKLPPGEVVARHEEREKADVAGFGGGKRCRGCWGGLQQGTVRWWACERCWRECRCGLHPDFDAA